MALAHGTHVSSTAVTTNATSYAFTASNAPTGAAGTLLIATVVVTGGSGEEPPTVSGNGVTWSIVQSTLHGSTIRFITYQADGVGATSAAFTVSGWGTSRTGCGGKVNEMTGVNTATIGVGAGNSIVQVASVASGTGTSGASNALAAYSDGANRPYAFTEHVANEATSIDTTPAGWVEIGAGNYNNPAQSFEIAWHPTSQETDYTPTWTTSSAWRTTIMELNGASGAVTGPPFPPRRPAAMVDHDRFSVTGWA